MNNINDLRDLRDSGYTYIYSDDNDTILEDINMYDDTADLPNDIIELPDSLRVEYIKESYPFSDEYAKSIRKSAIYKNYCDSLGLDYTINNEGEVLINKGGFRRYE